MADNTYIGYAERSAETQIDWAGVGKSISDMLNTEADIREQKKAAIDEETRAYQKALAESTRGNSEHLNAFTSDFVDQATEYKMMINQLLKSGQMKVKDYTAATQNLTDNTSQMFDVMNQAQEYYTKHMQRLESNEASAIEGQIMEFVEAFANVGSSRAYIDPGSGRVTIAKLVSDGGVMKMDTSAAGHMSIGKLRDRLNTYVQRFDVDAELSGREEVLGDVSQAMVEISKKIGDPSIIRTISDKKLGQYGLTQEEQEVAMNFLTYEQDMIGEVLSNNTHFASVLADGVGGYSITYSKEEAESDPKKIFVDQSSGVDKYVFNAEQKQEAENFLRNRFRSMIGVKETATSAGMRPDTRRESDISKGKGIEKSANVMSNLALLYYGDAGEVDQATSHLAGANKDILTITKTVDFVEIIYRNGDRRTLDFKGSDGELISQEDFVKGNASLFGITEDVDAALRKSKYDPNRGFSEAVGSYEVQVEKKEAVSEAFNRVVTEKVASFNPGSTNENVFTKDLNVIIPTIPGLEGISARTAVRFVDAFVLEDEDGNEVSGVIRLNEFGTLDKARDEVRKMLVGLAERRASTEDMAKATSGKIRTRREAAKGEALAMEEFNKPAEGE